MSQYLYRVIVWLYAACCFAPYNQTCGTSFGYAVQMKLTSTASCLVQSAAPCLEDSCLWCRQRRCRACVHVSTRMAQQAKAAPPLSVAAHGPQCDANSLDSNHVGTCSVSDIETQGALAERQFLCLLQVCIAISARHWWLLTCRC